jgi:predicted enzyme related to lactoylglutathione lyase
MQLFLVAGGSCMVVFRNQASGIGGLLEYPPEVGQQWVTYFSTFWVRCRVTWRQLVAALQGVTKPCQGTAPHQ